MRRAAVPDRSRRDDFATKQPDDHAERLIEPVADRVMIDAEHVGIVSQGTGASAEHEAAHQPMIESSHTALATRKGL